MMAVDRASLRELSDSVVGDCGFVFVVDVSVGTERMLVKDVKRGRM